MSLASASLSKDANESSWEDPNIYAMDLRFLLSSIDVPAQSQIIEASEKTPLLSMFLTLDLSTVREVLSRDDTPESKILSNRQGLAVGETTEGLLSACMRLLELLDTPEDIPFLGQLVQREILYRILRTPQAGRFYVPSRQAET
jgi:hypothetical protein